MATPIRAHVGENFPPMRYPVVDFGFIRIGLCIGLCYTLRHNFLVALLVAGELAVFALHAGGILEESTA